MEENILKDIQKQINELKKSTEETDNRRLQQIEEIYESLILVCERLLKIENSKNEFGLTLEERLEKIEKRLDIKHVKKDNGVTLVDEYGVYKDL